MNISKQCAALRLMNSYHQMPPAQVITGWTLRKPPNRETPLTATNLKSILLLKKKRLYVKLNVTATQGAMFSSNPLVPLDSPMMIFPQAPVA
jgi:hypothetical protein